MDDREPEEGASADGESAPIPDPPAAPDPAERSSPEEAPAPADEPPLVDLEFRRLDPRYYDAERLGSRIVCLVLGLGGLVLWMLGFFLDWFGPTLRWVILGGGLIAVGALYRVGLWITRLELERTSYRLTPEFLEIRKGVIWRRGTHVPVSRLQHTDVSQGPIQRKYGIGTLIVHTAGTEDASVELSGIRHDRALQLRDCLIHRVDSAEPAPDETAADDD